MRSFSDSRFDHGGRPPSYCAHLRGLLENCHRSLRFFALVAVLTPSAVEANQAPVIDAFSASSTSVQPDGVLTLTVEAHDPDCVGICTTGCGTRISSQLTNWSATGGGFPNQNDGQSASPYTATAEWQAPATEGIYTITVSLSDTGNFLCGGRQTTSASLDVRVTTSTDQPPTVESLTASPALVFPGGTSSLDCTASDPEGDALAFSWSTDLGTVTPGPVTGNTAAATFTAASPGIAKVTCTATDPAGGFGSDSVGISVSGAQSERALAGPLVAPQRLASDSWGNLYVVDRQLGGIAVVNLSSGELVYRMPVIGATSVAVDWADRLLLGGASGAEVRTRAGDPLVALNAGAPLGRVSDVAVDAINQRYGVLHDGAGRIVVYDPAGVVTAAFGSTGDGVDQLKSPQGLAVTPSGEWVVSDTGHGRIKIFDTAGSVVASFGGLGGGAGEFIQLDDVTVDSAGVIYASDTFQSWVQAFGPDGSLRETLGSYGGEAGQLKTPTGVAVVEGMDRLLVASLNSSTLQVFLTSEQAPNSGPLPEASVSTTSLDFPDQAVGTVGAPQTVMLTNTGEAPLGVRGVSLAGDFGQTSDCGPFLDPGAGCSFEVTFTPTVAGAASGSMSIDTSAANGLLAIDLTGSAFVPPGVSLSRSWIRFADQPVGTISAPKSVTLTNSGTVSLTLSSISVAGEFMQGNDCPVTLAAGATCEIAIRFAPETVEDYLHGAVRIASDGVGSPQAIQLEGSGVPGLLLLAIDDVTVEEAGASATFRVHLSAPSDGSVSVEVFTTADSAAEDEDYEPIATTLAFGAGVTERSVVVAVIDDSILERDQETFFVQLANPIGASLEDERAIGTITDDETCPGPNLLVNASGEVAAVADEIPGWFQAPGQSWRIGSTPPDPVDGEAYFAAGGASLAELHQDLDVGGFAQTIDTGQQRFQIEAWVQSATESPADEGWIELEYRDALDFVIGTASTARVVIPGAWQAVTATLQPPPGTRTVRVRLLAEQMTGPDTDVLFDALELRPLRSPTVVVADVAEYEGDSGTVDFPFAVRLACPYWQPVTVDYATADGSAVAGEDYLAVSGTLTLPTGAVEDPVSVTVIGDQVDEGHESFELGLTLIDPAEAVLVDGRALGLIVNDDFCPLGVGYWRRHRDAWPVSRLVLGGVLYDRPALEALLGYRRADAAAKLARQLVAVLFDLELGSDPAVWSLVREADAFLTVHPPGSQPVGPDAAEAERLKSDLELYTSVSCPGD